MRITTSAPTRIDLAGGTIDIWPLYLFHEGAQTINAAISLRAHAALDPRADGRIVIRSEDTGAVVEADDWRHLRERRELRLRREVRAPAVAAAAVRYGPEPQAGRVAPGRGVRGPHDAARRGGRGHQIKGGGQLKLES